VGGGLSVSVSERDSRTRNGWDVSGGFATEERLNKRLRSEYFLCYCILF
jgi:hypothetical protein